MNWKTHGRGGVFKGSLLFLAFALPASVTLAWPDGRSTSTSEVKIQKVKSHHIAIQVNADDPATMKHAVTNSLNAIKAYQQENEPVAIEIVAYGPGIHMFRVDTSPVKDLLQFLRRDNPDVVFSVCGNTKAIMERNEGRQLFLTEGTRVVPSGVVRLVELQEAGWSYVRP
jgi:uncharacterized protein